jgi:hypothetical protein
MAAGAIWQGVAVNAQTLALDVAQDIDIGAPAAGY